MPNKFDYDLILHINCSINFLGEETEKNSATGDGDEEKLDAVIKHPVYVCRASHNGLWIPGQLVFGKSVCQVSSFGVVMTFAKYEVLENTAESARLSWVKFSKFDKVPTGAVYGGEDAFIARRIIDSKDGKDSFLGRRHYVGKIRQQGFTHNIIVLTGVS